ncbi:hypothetical protein [Lysobacter capsici]|uniref:hypothetical protein n=1 Tax=Lysobacter capsici TaxID=435897 RepID=UPI0012FD2060|nr:hypothetical protein [Lysobacter capsici]
MSRKTTPAMHAETIVSPVDAFVELTPHDELVSIARTIDPTDAPKPSIRKHKQSRRRTLAKVFRLWVEQIDRSLIAMRPA